MLCCLPSVVKALLIYIKKKIRADRGYKNPRTLYVWCFSHVLNLVVADTCDKFISIRNFFGDMQILISFMRARKLTAIFLE
jgi:hypothetical protein